MTNYEFILNECKKAHYGAGWNLVAVEACVDKLNGLSRDELLRLFTSRWLGKTDEVRKAIFQMLFSAELEARAASIKEATIDELASMLKERNCNYVSMARKELKDRYQRASHDTQMLIIRHFKQASAKQDVKWGEVREKWQARGFANPPSIFDSWKK